MLLADFGFSAIMSIIAVVSSITMAVIAHNRQPETAEEGSTFGPKGNQADPGDPCPLPLGAPRWTPPILAREVLLRDYRTGEMVLNSGAGDFLRPHNTMIYDLGVGPMDGGDFNAWLDGEPAFEVVNDVTNPEHREVLPDTRYSTRTHFFFPKLNVEQEGCEFYLDGEIYAVGEGTALASYGYEKFSAKPGFDTVEQGGKDRTIIRGDELWVNGDNVKFRLKVEMLNYLGSGTGTYKYVDATVGNGVRWTPVVTTPDDPFQWGDQSKTELVYLVDETIEPQVKVGWSGYRRARKVVEVTVTGERSKVKTFKVETDRSTLASTAVFAQPVPSGKTTAHYKSFPLGLESNLKITKSFGTLDQKPFPTHTLGGSTQTYLTSKEVTHASVTTYDSSVPVSNMMLLFSSGAGGFYNMVTNGPRRYNAYIKIEVKLDSAPDKPANTTGPLAYDPLRGWVPLTFAGMPALGDVLQLGALVQNGYARWQFRVSDGLDNTKRRVFPKWTTQSRLPVKGKWQIKITRTDVVAADHDGARELFLEAVTEQNSEMYSFPGRALMRVDYDEAAGIKSEPKVEVQFKARECRMVTSFDGAGNPVFRRAWTRNPVWQSCEVITDGLTGGAVAGHGDETIDWQSAKLAADWCDEKVKWDGTTDTRSESDYVLTKQRTLFRALTDICGGSGVSPAFSRGKWFFPYDDDGRTPVIDPLTSKDWTLGDADILDEEDGNPVDGITFERKSIEQTATDIHITFVDEDNAFDKDADPVMIPIANEAVRIRNIRKVDFPAVRRRWQVERVGTRLREDEENNYRFASIRPNNLRTLALDPGDVFVLDCPSAKIPSGQKAMIIERTPGGHNGRQELRVLLLGKLVAQKPPSTTGTGPAYTGGLVPNGAVKPGYRRVPANIPTSSILKVEEL
jgi:hypothetical protein